MSITLSVTQTQNNISKCITNPIPIPIANSSNKHYTTENIEYCLKRNFFDPNKCSPPNSWNTRLMMRLESSSDAKLMQTNN